MALANRTAQTKPPLIDRIIARIDPVRAVNRQLARNHLTALQKRAYEGASRADGWRPARAGASANTDHYADGTELRVRARALRQNVPYIDTAIVQRTGMVVGTGIVPRSLAKNADEVSKVFDQFKNSCDADGRSNFYGLQALIYATRRVDGEVLIRRRPRRVSDGLAVPLQFQVLEIDWLDTGKQGRGDAGEIINGIEYDALGRVANYWIFTEHPGEIRTQFRAVNRTSKAVPASEIIHSYRQERPGQGRGFTSLASVIPRVRDLQLLEDAHLARKNLEARLSVLTSGGTESLPPPDANAEEAAAGISNMGQLASGGIVDVGPGRTITPFDPKATPDHIGDVKHQLHIIAAACGVTYEMITGDGTSVNFSSARILGINIRRDVEMEQWTDFIPGTLEKLMGWFFDAAILAGKLPLNQDRSLDYSTPRWEYVNPMEDVQSDALLVASGMGTLSEVIRRRGYEPKQVFKEHAEDMQRLAGVEATSPLRTMLHLLSKQVLPVQAEPSPAPKPERSSEDIARSELSQSQTRTMETLATKFAEVASRAAQAPAQIDVHNHIAPPVAHVTVQPTPVEVRSDVHVAPTPVQVTNQVLPTPVEVRNEVTAQAAPAQVVVSRPAQEAQLRELFEIHGLDPAKPLSVTDTQRSAGSISQAISSTAPASGVTTSVTRLP